MYLNGAPAGIVHSGDLVCIEAGESQAIENTGTTDLVFLCVCRPAFHNEGYRDCEPEV
jgi:mannose-6-phosphate isomerase-like protein (cupin superfamily)